MATQETAPALADSQPLSPTITTSQWLLTYLLASVPVVGFILLAGWAYNPRTPASKANWARATLLVLIVLGTLLFLTYRLMDFLSDYRRSIAD